MKIYSKAGGGLGNRILGSVTAYYFSSLLGEPLHIDWPEGNPGCLATWKDLFVDTEEIINEKIEETDETFYIVHNLAYFQDKKNILCHRNGPEPKDLLRGSPKMCGSFREKSNELLEGIISNRTDTDILIQDDGAYIDRIPMDTTISFFTKGLKIRDDILNTARAFCKKHDVTNKTIGIHLRLTDMLHFGFNAQSKITGESEDSMLNSILSQYIDKIESIISKSPSTRFFVCSDDPRAEAILTDRFPVNVSAYSKAHYAEKFHKDAEWSNIDETGQDLCRYNVSRSSESVIEAMIDCLILSRTRTEFFPRIGSFNALARYLNIVEFD